MAHGLGLRSRGLILLGVVCAHASLLLLPGPDFAGNAPPVPLQVRLVAQTISASGMQALPEPVRQRQADRPAGRPRPVQMPVAEPSRDAPVPAQPVLSESPAQTGPAEAAPPVTQKEERSGRAEAFGVAPPFAGTSVASSVRTPASCDTRLRQEDYPISARRDEIEGRVVVHARVARSGRVEEVRVARRSGHAVLDEAALRAARHWRCSPASQDGMTVDSWVSVSVVFRLDA